MHHADTSLPTFAPKLSTELQQQFGCASSLCPYGLNQHAVYHQAAFTRMDNKTMGD